jgi:mannose-6-phosphate isomerase-like protein (cupin superfamily)
MSDSKHCFPKLSVVCFRAVGRHGIELASETNVRIKKGEVQMNPLLKRVALIVGTALLVAAGVSLAGVAPAAVHFVDHDKVAATFEKSGTIIDEPGLRVVTQRRDGGLAEYHEHTGHIFIMYDGEGTLVVGGTIVGAKTTGPGQIRGDSIDGGQSFHVSKGDVITIPAKTPHWFKDLKTKTIAYYAVNVEND